MELRLQAVRIGDLGITAIPDEVFGITGLKLKARSPLVHTMNIELANGAEGYIPPPEQHDLGGYTTWPARTAGLEVRAEPVIVETLLRLLEQVMEVHRSHWWTSCIPIPRQCLNQNPRPTATGRHRWLCRTRCCRVAACCLRSRLCAVSGWAGRSGTRTVATGKSRGSFCGRTRSGRSAGTRSSVFIRMLGLERLAE